MIYYIYWIYNDLHTYSIHKFASSAARPPLCDFKSEPKPPLPQSFRAVVEMAEQPPKSRQVTCTKQGLELRKASVKAFAVFLRRSSMLLKRCEALEFEVTPLVEHAIIAEAQGFELCL